MARFDLHAGLGEGIGYVVNVQADLLDSLATRVVVPLIPRASVKVIRDLNPIVRIDDMDYVVMTQELAAVPRSSLRRTIGSVPNGGMKLRARSTCCLLGFDFEALVGNSGPHHHWQSCAIHGSEVRVTDCSSVVEATSGPTGNRGVEQVHRRSSNRCA